MNRQQPIDIGWMLNSVQPPEPGQLIVYRTEGRRNNRRRLHSAECLDARGRENDEQEDRRVPAEQLQKQLADGLIDEVCGWCLDGGQIHAKLLLRNSYLDGGALVKPVYDHWYESALMMYYEAHKPGHVDEWCRWAHGKTSGQIAAEAQHHLGWGANASDGDTREELAAVFESRGCGTHNWMLAANTHVAVREGTSRAHVAVHGLLPLAVAKQNGGDVAAIIIPVDKTFTGTHLKLAVSLYEADEDVRYGVAAAVRRAAARRAVETAWLCSA